MNIQLQQTFVSHFQQEGLAGYFIHDTGEFPDLVQFERFLVERAQDISRSFGTTRLWRHQAR